MEDIQPILDHWDLITFACSVLAFPFLLYFHQLSIEKKKLRLSSGQQLKKHQYAFSGPTFIAVGLLSVLVGGFVLRSESSKAGVPELEFLTLEAYRHDVESNPAYDATTLRAKFNDSLRIFRHAVDLYNRQHFDLAAKSLISLKAGQDEFAELLPMESYVVLNNLGVVHFHAQRNKNFLASRHLLDALEVEHIDDTMRNRILRNIEKLNNAVNMLD